MRFFRARTRSVCVTALNGDISCSNVSVGEFVDFLQVEGRNHQELILRINSHGGSLSCAQNIASSVGRWKSLDPRARIYAVIDEVGLSAAFYVALGCDRIYAERASLVGGVGAIIKMDDFSGLYEKLGISIKTYRSGAYKDVMNVKRASEDLEEKMLDGLMTETHEQFLEWLNERRPKLEEYDDIVEGKWFTGSHAKSIGLIDETSGYTGLLSRLEDDLAKDGIALNVRIIDSQTPPQAAPSKLKAVLQYLGLNTRFHDMLVK